MVSIIEYWREISGAIGAIVLFIAGRKSTKLTEKQQQVDAITTMQKTYDTFLGHYDSQYKKLATQVDKLQNAFVELQLAYAKEIEKVESGRKLYRELQVQYKDLEKKYNTLEHQYLESEKRYGDLEKLYSKLKTDFDKHKKSIA